MQYSAEFTFSFRCSFWEGVVYGAETSNYVSGAEAYWQPRNQQKQMSHNVPIRPSLSLFISFKGRAWNNNCNAWNNNNCNCKDKIIAIKLTSCRKLWDAIYYNWHTDRTRLETLCRSIRSTEMLKTTNLTKTYKIGKRRASRRPCDNTLVVLSNIWL